MHIDSDSNHEHIEKPISTSHEHCFKNTDCPLYFLLISAQCKMSSVADT